MSDAFRRLQERLPDPFAAPGVGTVVVLPSMSMDLDGMAKIPGVRHLEERFLSFLLLLRRPRTRVVYVTGAALDPAVVAYALGLLAPPGGRDRLTLVHCADPAPVPLTAKVLGRARTVEEIRRAVPDPGDACLLAFNGSPDERELAVRLGVPLFAADPALAHLGSKSGSRRIFAAAGVPVADGVADLRDEHGVAAALAGLRERDPDLAHGIVKLNDGFGAGGNVLFPFAGAPAAGLPGWVGRELLRRAVFASPPDTWDAYRAKIVAMGAVVERFVTAERTRSPSAQVLVSPAGEVRVVSTQDQLFGGPAGQIYVGGTFPADGAYRAGIHAAAARVGATLAARGVRGLLSVDFLAADDGSCWRRYGLEINLRMGGGTAPYVLFDGLVGGRFDPATGTYLAPDGAPRCFLGTDRLQHDRYRALTPSAVLAAARRHGVHFAPGPAVGVAFYMLGALEVGRLGVVAVDRTPAGAAARYEEVVAILDAAASAAATAVNRP